MRKPLRFVDGAEQQDSALRKVARREVEQLERGRIGPPHLTPSCRRQHQELERQPNGQRHRRCPRGLDGHGHLSMRQRPHVLHDVTLGTQDRVDPVAGVVDPELHRHRPLQHRADALPQPPGGVSLRVPDGSEDLKHVGASDLRDRHLPDAREGVPLEGQDPLAAVRPTSPAGLLLFYHARGGFGEARYALPTMLLGKRVAALAGQLAVGQRLFPGLGEGDQRDAAESRARGLPTPDEQALNPASGSARLDEEVQPVAVRVSSRRGGAHESSRQGLVWMTALGLGFPGRAGRVRYRIHPPII